MGDFLLRYIGPVLMVLAGLYATYSHGVKVTNSEWQAKWNAHLAEDATKTAQAQAEQRAIETARQHSIDKVTQDAQQAIDRAHADAADAAALAGSVQQAADRLAARLADSQARVSACTTDASKAASKDARLLADVLKRADSRAGHLAGVADQAIERGRACERAYDAVRASDDRSSAGDER
jgi:hypothetical protein